MQSVEYTILRVTVELDIHIYYMHLLCGAGPGYPLNLWASHKPLFSICLGVMFPTIAGENKIKALFTI